MMTPLAIKPSTLDSTAAMTDCSVATDSVPNQPRQALRPRLARYSARSAILMACSQLTASGLPGTKGRQVRPIEQLVRTTAPRGSTHFILATRSRTRSASMHGVFDVLRMRDHHEFVAAPAHQHVVGTDGLAQRACATSMMSFVAGGVAVLVVDGLQRIEIDDHDGQALAALVLGEQPRELLHQVAAIREAGERVGELAISSRRFASSSSRLRCAELVGAIADLLLELQRDAPRRARCGAAARTRRPAASAAASSA